MLEYLLIACIAFLGFGYLMSGLVFIFATSFKSRKTTKKEETFMKTSGPFLVLIGLWVIYKAPSMVLG